MNWRSAKTDPPPHGTHCIVAAWEFGCKPQFFTAMVWQSFDIDRKSQPPKYYLDETYRTDCPIDIGADVRLWSPLELPTGWERLDSESIRANNPELFA
jgi:hypothetical protein